MDLKNKSSISEFLDLQRKAILTLYTYTENLKTTTTDINMSLNDIVADTEINKMDIDTLRRNMDKIININDKMVVLMDKYTCSTIDNTLNYERQDRNIKMIVEEVDKIIVNRRREKICYVCDFIILVSAITAVYFFK